MGIERVCGIVLDTDGEIRRLGPENKAKRTWGRYAGILARVEGEDSARVRDVCPRFSQSRIADSDE